MKKMARQNTLVLVEADFLFLAHRRHLSEQILATTLNDYIWSSLE
jgi:hypothetical protein